MDERHRMAGGVSALGGGFGAFAGAAIDLWTGTSGLAAFVLSGLGSMAGAYLGFRMNADHRRDVDSPCASSLEADIRRQHHAMWSLMGGMVGGMAGSVLGALLPAAVWVLHLHRVPTAMEFMTLFNVIMGGSMSGMAGGTSGAWLAASRAGVVGRERTSQEACEQASSQLELPYHGSPVPRVRRDGR
ncbi:hypothetical protein [Alicyclobacillus macrosporangiidus]|uniref:Uncharacterized protein n=1 Tax=Alicyclobacillus macrosporangiidus TaxID=392015 RepID=A0A1I7JIX1_9BACL|nr:hypothetical protein [Alicyclobacillus macrosporangiidus]SFU85096.1 hypothetical protein SAMN05421543_11063 [Alicyclobacillus macrosporangiidus]